MLITIEGIDGSGKTSVWRMLRQEFPGFVFTREPTDSDFGRYVKAEIGKSRNPFFDLFLFMADHALHVRNVIEPAIREGKIVVCDRYIDSRIAYQGSALENTLDDPYEWIKKLHSWSRFPDITLLLDLSPEKAIERCGERASRMKFENVEFLKKVRDAYLRMAGEEERFVVISADRSLDDVFRDVKKTVTGVLSRNS